MIATGSVRGDPANCAAEQWRGAAALLIALLVGYAAAPAAAGQPDAGPHQPNGDPTAVDYNGLDYTRQQESAEFRLRFQNSSSPTSQTDQERLYLKLSTKIEIPVGWDLALQGQLPFVDKEVTASATQNTTREAGLGDAYTQAVVAHPIDSHWAYGFGARLVAPTGGDNLGSGKWQIMPGLGVRYALLEVGPDTYFTPQLRWALSFAGDPAKPTINQPQIAPTLNIGLPQHWFFTLYPSNDIRINTGTAVAGQTGKLFLPFDSAIGRNITERITALLEVSVPIVKDYPVYNFKTEFRVSVKF